ncbi:MAG: 2-keto-4-pentenoate hydratase [Gammaproteobacteria bacterium]|nr:2-keto-4-pentenoate hydratase [Gammaproteobacteria bacterium]
MDHQSALHTATILAAARRAGRRLHVLEPAPDSLEDGYQIQDLVVTCYGEQVGAWKIGATHPNAQAGLGVPGPVASRLFSRNLLQGSQRVKDTFLIRGLEAEYAFRLGADLPARATPYTREEILDAVVSVHPAIEIVDTRFDSARSGPVAIADNVNDGLLIYGEGRSDWRDLDMVEAAVNMEVNGEIVVRGRGAEVLGNPLASLTWLVNEHAAAREGLRAGQIITTGSCTGLYKSPPGCRARATFEGLGELSVQFEA